MSLPIWKVRRHYFSYKNPQFFAKKKLSSQLELLCVKTLPSFYSDYSKKSLFISVANEFYENYLVTQDYCVSTHDLLCSSENCKFHLVLIGISVNQILQRLDKRIYIYQEIDCLYTLFKRFSI